MIYTILIVIIIVLADSLYIYGNRKEYYRKEYNRYLRKYYVEKNKNQSK